MATVQDVAQKAEAGLEAAVKVEESAAPIISIFVPQMSLVQPWIILLAPFLERALNDIASNNGTDLFNAIPELIQHVSKGMPNSPALNIQTEGSA
jgi:hypothetical protein